MESNWEDRKGLKVFVCACYQNGARTYQLRYRSLGLLVLREYVVEVGNFRFPCHVGGLVESIGKLKDLDADRFVIVSDDRVARLYTEELSRHMQRLGDFRILEFPHGEKSKNFGTLRFLLESMVRAGLTKRSCVIALGGGVVGNVAGLAASLLFRGVKFVNIPTTLLAIIDSGLSLKQAINGPSGKNQVGAFYPPNMVMVDWNFLRTLDCHELNSGLVEVVKFVVSICPENVNLLLRILNSECKYSQEDLVSLFEISLTARQKVTSDDPYEAKSGLVLEYGHTLGHVLEFIGGGGLTHGEAVAHGMKFAADISAKMGYLSSSELELQRALLGRIEMPSKRFTSFSISEIIACLYRDNKLGRLNCSESQIPMVLLERLGHPIINDGIPLHPVPLEVVKSTIANLGNR